MISLRIVGQNKNRNSRPPDFYERAADFFKNTDFFVVIASFFLVEV